MLGKNELDIINYYFTSHLLILCPNRNVGDCSPIDSVKEGYFEYFLPYVSADLVKNGKYGSRLSAEISLLQTYEVQYPKTTKKEVHKAALTYFWIVNIPTFVNYI